MADKRKPLHRIVWDGPDGRTVLELFPAEGFPGGASSSGRFRARINRAWYMPGGQKYAFITLQDALAIFTGVPTVQSAPRPDLKPGHPVRVPTWKLGDIQMYDVTRVSKAPFQGPDGRWRVFVALHDAPFLVDDLKP